MSSARTPAPVPPHEPAPDSVGELTCRLRRAGPRALDDLDALRLAGGVSEPQARALLAEFGSLPEVLCAPPGALQRVVSPARAARLAFAHDLVRRQLEAPLRARPEMSAGRDLAAYLRGVLGGRSREQFRGLFVDHKIRLIRDEVLGEGTVDHAPAYPREVVRRALELDACGVILAHNHPSGDPRPSAADVEMTRQVVAAARPLRIAVHDHLVVGGAEVASLRALGLM